MRYALHVQVPEPEGLRKQLAEDLHSMPEQYSSHLRCKKLGVLMMKKEEMVYYPEHDFNGVLFILREPHDDQKRNLKDVFIGNRNWYVSVAKTPENHLQAQYQNRFKEMLSVLGIIQQDQDALLHSAFDNVKKTGGGPTASKTYRKMGADEKKARIIEMIEAVRPKNVFLPRDLYRIISDDATEKAGGITYVHGAQFEKCSYMGATFYEIYHPAHRRRIDTVNCCIG